jgi:nitrite reductase/ring-hydroxylating ferredoxin subunit
LIGLYLLLAIVPGCIFFSDKGGLTLLKGLDFPGACGALVPLFGLYAFFVVWGQILIGSSMSVLRRQIAWIETYHRAQGVFVLLLALTHPLLLWISLGNKDFFAFSFVPPEQRIFVMLGVFQLSLVVLTVCTALLMKLPILINRWLYIHYLNYVVFACVIVHSWNLGSDLMQSQPLRCMWVFMGVTGVASLIARYWRSRPKIVAPPPSGRTGAAGEKASTSQTPSADHPRADEGFVPAVPVAELVQGKPVCALVNEKKVLICQLEDGVFAIDDTCTHAGGSLSKGTLEGATIECPRHGAKFDLRTGSVVSPPAKLPVTAYKVRVVDEQVEVKPAQ